MRALRWLPLGLLLLPLAVESVRLAVALLGGMDHATVCPV
jgi:hypothetical protein